MLWPLEGDKLQLQVSRVLETKVVNSGTYMNTYTYWIINMRF